ncbi:MAG: RidA family protein [Chitinophagaceae bacterium]
MSSIIENRIAELGYSLPQLPVSKGIYKRCVQSGHLLFSSGSISVNNDGTPITGKLGDDCSDERGIEAARQCGLAMLAGIKESIGSLDKIDRVVKILGMVNATPDYTNHPIIINGCSVLFRDVFGEDNGVGARSAVGMGSLPGNVAVEIEAIFELKD